MVERAQHYRRVRKRIVEVTAAPRVEGNERSHEAFRMRPDSLGSIHIRNRICETTQGEIVLILRSQLSTLAQGGIQRYYLFRPPRSFVALASILEVSKLALISQYRSDGPPRAYTRE